MKKENIVPREQDIYEEKIKEIDKKIEVLKIQIINDIFNNFHPELMSYKPYSEYVSLSMSYRELKIKEINLIKEIENKETKND